MSISGTKFLLSESFPCGYYEDGRMATIDYYGQGQPARYPFEKKVLGEIRKNRFSLMQRGLIGSIFSATANDCIGCNACVPVRINTLNFNQTTRQTRVLQNFRDHNGEAIWAEPDDAKALIPDLYKLYKKYLAARFPKSHMNDTDLEDLGLTILSKSQLLLLTTPDNDLLGFTQVDREGAQASLDYIVYDPDKADLYLGSVSFLESIAWAQENFIPYIYIGSTNDSRALKYKRYYSGLETFDGENWVPYNPKQHTQGPDYDSIVQQFPAQRL